VTLLADEAQARTWFREVLRCDALAFDRLEALVAMLREENQRQNLVSARSLDDVWVRHLADSAQLTLVSRGTPPGEWMDLGSGAGFPGLIIAVLEPSRHVVLVESRSRRIEWLERAVDALRLNASVKGARLESLDANPARVISARAFAPLPRILEAAARFSTDETQWLLPKGRGGAIELRAMPEKIQNMFHVEPSLTDPDSVILVGRGRPR
jgi:16S rRNA (guanine527-N7)-methyltransferase